VPIRASADRATAVALNQVLIEQFIGSFGAPPEEIVFDFDATDVPVHGRQEGRFFRGYYDHHCFLPLYVFCGEQLFVADLRPSKIDAAKQLLAGLAYSLLTAVRRLGLTGTELARAQAGTIRLKLLKIGAVIWRNTRRIRPCLSSACPDKGSLRHRRPAPHCGVAAPPAPMQPVCATSVPLCSRPQS